MKAVSAHTLESDPYRAGIQLADAVKRIEPEVVFLFPTIFYEGSKEMTEAIYDVLGDRVTLIGATGDGFFEATRTADFGASALALSSGGGVKWKVAKRSGARGDTVGAVTACLTELREAMAGGPDLVILFCDFRADGSAVEAAIRGVMDDVPVVGGLAGDNNMRMERCFTYANREALEDSVVALGIKGAIRFDIRVAHELRPVGHVGVVTSAEGTRLRLIDDVGAMAFVEREIGRPVTKVDQGIVTFNVLDRDTFHTKYLRSIVPDSGAADGGLSLFGGVPQGARVQVCIAQPDDIVGEVRRIADDLGASPFRAEAALIVSCAGRKHLLGNRIEHEANEVTRARSGDIALAGFPSFGEIGPVKIEGKYTDTFFHNMTYVLLLLG
jgi:hypothetical protein